MKRTLQTMLALAVVLALPLALNRSAEAQRGPAGPLASPAASVSQTIGTETTIEVKYHRPGVKGRTIWTGDNPEPNTVVPHNNNPGPWRAGANNATTFAFSTDVKIEGQPLPAGTYSFFIIPTGGDWTLIFNKVADQWGAYNYDQSQDALRVEVTPEDAPHQEWLVYGFDDLEPYAADAYMHWGTKKVSFRIEVANQPQAEGAEGDEAVENTASNQ